MIAEFHYRVPWRAQGAHPGHHAGAQTGGGFEFQGYAPFFQQPDSRNLDARATLADPFERLTVKSFRQRAAVPVYVLADLSASMGFAGQARKTALLAEFAAAAAWSAWRSGDPFGFFGCAEEILWDICLPLRWHKGMAQTLRERLAGFAPEAGNASGLLEAAAYLGRPRALVFLVSDFHLDETALEALLGSFVHHALVPVVLWDSGEYENLPRWGLAELQDPETGQRRRLFLRPALREKLAARFAERREDIIRICSRHGCEPFFVVDRFDPDAMTGYFFQS